MLLAVDIMESLTMMWQGMLGIFIVIGIVALSVVILTRITGRKKKSKKDDDSQES